MFASYNAGKGNILQAQQLAVEKGLNPYVWTSIVRTLPAVTGDSSRETIVYVDRVHKIKNVLHIKALSQEVFEKQELRLDEGDVEAETALVEVELEKRDRLFRGGQPLPDLSDRAAILVDDGLASGYTMLSSIKMAKDLGARVTVAAVPTAPQRTIERIETEVDEVYCPNIRTGMFFAVADAYTSWYDLQEGEVLDLLQKKAWSPY